MRPVRRVNAQCTMRLSRITLRVLVRRRQYSTARPRFLRRHLDLLLILRVANVLLLLHATITALRPTEVISVLRRLSISTSSTTLKDYSTSNSGALNRGTTSTTICARAKIRRRCTFLLCSTRGVRYLLTTYRQRRTVRTRYRATTEPSVNSLRRDYLTTRFLLTRRRRLHARYLRLLFCNVRSNDVIVRTVEQRLITTTCARRNLALRQVSRDLNLHGVLLIVCVRGLISEVDLRLRSLCRRLTLRITRATRTLLRAIIGRVRHLITRTMSTAQGRVIVTLLLVIRTHGSKFLIQTLLVRRANTLNVLLFLRTGPRQFFVVRM